MSKGVLVWKYMVRKILVVLYERCGKERGGWDLRGRWIWKNLWSKIVK